jgi:3',5'-cyclic-AMP phosphodiesterase
MSDTIGVLQLTDLHLTAHVGEPLLAVDTQQTLDRVLVQALRGGRTDLVLLTGDIAHHPEPHVYVRAIETLSRHYSGPWLWTPGNHDLAAPLSQAAAYLRVPAAGARQRTLGDWAFYMVDTHADDRIGGRVAVDEIERLDAFLGTTTARHIAVAGHHPLCPIGTPWLDEDRVSNAEALWQRFLDDGRVRVFLSGHVHQPFESWQDGVLLLTTPSTCFQFAPGSAAFATDDRPPGWRRLELSDDGGIHTTVEWAITQ